MSINKRYPKFKDFLKEATSSDKWTDMGVPKKRRDNPDFDIKHSYDSETGELKSIQAIEKNISNRPEYLKAKYAMASDIMIEFEQQVKLLKDINQKFDEIKKIQGYAKTDLMKTMYKIVGMNPGLVDKKPSETEAKDRVGIIIETLNVSANLTAKLLKPDTTDVVINYQKAVDGLKEVFKGNKDILNVIEIELGKSKEIQVTKGISRSESFGGSALKIKKDQINRKTERDIDDMFDDIIGEGVVSDIGSFFKNLYLKLRRMVSKVESNLEIAKDIVDNLK